MFYPLKDRSSSDSEDRSPTIDLSKPPPVGPPEFKRVQLFKSPTIFENLDSHVLDVSLEKVSLERLTQHKFCATNHGLGNKKSS